MPTAGVLLASRRHGRSGSGVEPTIRAADARGRASAAFFVEHARACEEMLASRRRRRSSPKQMPARSAAFEATTFGTV